MPPPVALPSLNRDFLTSDFIKFLGADGKFGWGDVASLIALVVADGNGYKTLYSQFYDYTPPVDTVPNSIFGGTAYGTPQVVLADINDGSRLTIKFRMRYTLGDGDSFTIVGKLKNLSDDSEYDFLLTSSNSQDFVFGQPSDDGFVETSIKFGAYGPTFVADAEWRGGAEPSKQNGPKDAGGSIGSDGPYEVEITSQFTTAAMGSALIVNSLSIVFEKGPA